MTIDVALKNNLSPKKIETLVFGILLLIPPNRISRFI